MYWNDKRIESWAENGGITPYNPELVNPASIDLRIGNKYRFPLKQDWSEERDIPESGVYMTPNSILLFHSVEYIKVPHNAVGFLYLKSSTGRRGLEHLHAGYIDPGFEGEVTFEITCHWPDGRKVVPGERFCQITFAECEKPRLPYGARGHYQKQKGPTPQWMR